jgi:hypothetical protein
MRDELTSFHGSAVEGRGISAVDHLEFVAEPLEDMGWYLVGLVDPIQDGFRLIGWWHGDWRRWTRVI